MRSRVNWSLQLYFYHIIKKELQAVSGQDSAVFSTDVALWGLIPLALCDNALHLIASDCCPTALHRHRVFDNVVGKHCCQPLSVDARANSNKFKKGPVNY